MIDNATRFSKHLSNLPRVLYAAFFLFCLMASCKKDPVATEQGSDALSLSVDEAKLHFEQYVQKRMPPSSLDQRSSADRTPHFLDDKEALWESAREKLLESGGNSVLVPLNVANMYVQTSSHGAIKLKDLNYLFMYRDSIGEIQADWVVLYPDSAWAQGDRDHYTGLLKLADLDGMDKYIYHFGADGSVSGKAGGMSHLGVGGSEGIRSRASGSGSGFKASGGWLCVDVTIWGMECDCPDGSAINGQYTWKVISVQTICEFNLGGGPSYPGSGHPPGSPGVPGGDGGGGSSSPNPWDYTPPNCDGSAPCSDGPQEEWLEPGGVNSSVSADALIHHYLSEYIDGWDIDYLYANSPISDNLLYFLSQQGFSEEGRQLTAWAVRNLRNSQITWQQFENGFMDGYSPEFFSNIGHLSVAERQVYVDINKEIETSAYDEELVKEANELFVAYAAYGDVENLTEAQIRGPGPIISPSMALAVMNAKQARKTILDYHFYRKHYPNWSKSRCFWEACRETIQTALDIGGMLPVIGEVCDLTNATIYALNGDGLNASLSAAGAIPFAGWFPTGSKYAIKATNIQSKQVLKWIVRSDGVIDFGRSGQLRKVLQLTDGSKHAHHIVPWQFRDNALIQKAAKSNNAFHMNDVINGIPLPSTNHLTGHQAYNTKVGQILTNLNNGNPSIEVAYQRLIGFNNYLRTLIVNNPNANLGQIANLINYP